MFVVEGSGLGGSLRIRLTMGMRTGSIPDRRRAAGDAVRKRGEDVGSGGRKLPGREVGLV